MALTSYFQYFIPVRATVITLTCPALWARLITAKLRSICDRFLLILLFLLEGLSQTAHPDASCGVFNLKETFMPDWAPMSMKMSFKYIFRINHSSVMRQVIWANFFWRIFDIPEKETALSNS